MISGNFWPFVDIPHIKVIFVKYGAPGDIVDLEIVGRKKKFSLAKINKIIYKNT